MNGMALWVQSLARTAVPARPTARRGWRLGRRTTALALAGLSAATLALQSAVSYAQVPTCVFSGRHYVVGDRVWNDADQDGVQDVGEAGLENVTVKLFRTGQGTQFAGQCRTNADGNYWLDASIGTYYVEFMRPTGYQLSPKDVGTDDLLDSDPNPTTGRTVTFYLSPANPTWHSDRWDAGMSEEGGGSVTLDLGSDHGDAPLPYPQTKHDVVATGATMQPTLALAGRVDTEDEGAIVRTGDTGKLATGDDILVDPGTSDEDSSPWPMLPPGVPHHVLVRGRTQDIGVPVLGSGFLNAWVDFDLDGTWDNGAERVASNLPTAGLWTSFPLTVPGDAVITYDPRVGHDWQDPAYRFSYIRLRLSSQPLNDPQTPAEDGEVEDHSIDIIEARPDVGVWVESVSRSPAIVGDPFTYHMFVNNSGFAPASQLVVTQLLQPGAEFVRATMTQGQQYGPISCSMNATTRVLTCTLPNLPAPMPQPQVRYDVELNLTGRLGCNMMQTIADITILETENYLVNKHASLVTPLEAGRAWDFADSPVSNNAVWWQGGPRHHVVPGLHLGNAPVDIEAYAIPRADALSDDQSETDDEDGVTIERPLIRSCNNGGQPGKIKVVAAGAGRLSAWFNWNGDTTFSNTANERVVHNFLLSPGEHVIDVTVPCNAVVGETYARFRFVAPDQSVDSARDPECIEVLDGEVEDHRFPVFAVPTPADLTVDKSDLFDPVAEGEEFSYTITVKNAGTTDARNVVASDVLPSELEFLNFTTTDLSATCTVDISTPSISCSFPEIKGSTETSITINVRVKLDVVPTSDPPLPEGDGLDISNTAIVNWDGGTERTDTEITRIVKPCALDLVFAIDVSASMSQSDLNLIGQAAIDMLDQLEVGEPDSLNRAAAVAFADTEMARVQLTQTRQQIDSFLGSLLRSGGGTNIVAGLDAAQNELDVRGRKDGQGHRTALPVIVLLSDGVHNDPLTDPIATARGIKATGTRIYTVAYGSQGTGGSGVPLLRDIATRADYALTANSVQDVATRFADIAARHCACSPCGTPTTPAPTTAVPTTPVPTTPVPTTPPPPSCATITADRACTPTMSCASSWCEWTVASTLPALACDPDSQALYSLDVTVDACDGQIDNMWVVLPSGVHAMQRLVPWSAHKWQVSLDCLTTRPPSTFTLRWINATGGYPGAGPKHVDYTVCCTTCP